MQGTRHGLAAISNELARDPMCTPGIGEADMTTSTEPATAGERYNTAYAVHYTTKDLREAVEQYHGIIAAHPDSPEAGYSRAQIVNIANSVVSKEALLEAYMSLTIAQLGNPDTDVAPAAPTTDTP